MWHLKPVVFVDVFYISPGAVALAAYICVVIAFSPALTASQPMGLVFLFFQIFASYFEEGQSTKTNLLLFECGTNLCKTFEIMFKMTILGADL